MQLKLQLILESNEVVQRSNEVLQRSNEEAKQANDLVRESNEVLRKSNEEAKQASEAAQHSAALTISVCSGVSFLILKANFASDLHSHWPCCRVFLHVTESCTFYDEF
jgi:hypothetical protein